MRTRTTEQRRTRRQPGPGQGGRGRQGNAGRRDDPVPPTVTARRRPPSPLSTYLYRHGRVCVHRTHYRTRSILGRHQISRSSCISGFINTTIANAGRRTQIQACVRHSGVSRARPAGSRRELLAGTRREGRSNVSSIVGFSSF
jgi:hypothetical protein